MNSTRGFIHLGVFFVFLASGAIACAADSNDPSGRVARLQYLSGDVSVQPHGTGEWLQGSVIQPLTDGDNVWADKNSRAELNLGSGRMRIDSETSLTLTHINDTTVQVELHQGILSLHIRRLESGEAYELDTPNLAFTVRKPGDYRFDVRPNGDTTLVTVRQGEGQATGQGPAVTVHTGEQAEFKGAALEHQVREAPPQDGFDKWCRVREQRLDQAVSARYVLHIGSSDVDEYPAWRENPGYSLLWVPTTVAPGGARYRNACWFWFNPWGSTWVRRGRPA